MSENIIDRPPTDEELAKTIQLPDAELGWEQFRVLDDEGVEVVRRQILGEVLGTMENPILAPQPETETEAADSDGDYWRLFDVADTFRMFADWRTYGIPDRTVTKEDLIENLRALVASRLEADPSYGSVPASYDMLSTRERSSIYHVFSYFDEMREPFERMTIDDYSLEQTLGLSPEDVAWLQRNVVLQQIGENPLEGNVYSLCDQYYDVWLLRKFGPAR